MDAAWSRAVARCSAPEHQAKQKGHEPDGKGKTCHHVRIEGTAARRTAAKEITIGRAGILPSCI